MAFHQERPANRRLNSFRRIAAGLWLALLAPVIAGPLKANADPSSANLYARAAAHEQVPLDVLVAIAGSESGFHPWALNIDGHEVYCHSRAEAEQRLATEDRVSIGLMQINWRYWGPRLGRTKLELLDPETNLIYGARILKEGLGRAGSLWLRISNYHSGSMQERDKYNQLVFRNYRRYLAGELPTENRAANAGAPRYMVQTGTPSVSEGNSESGSAGVTGRLAGSVADRPESTPLR
jgi:hypothetical protein